jgi:DNA-binding NarL/FixJ family response regulator
MPDISGIEAARWMSACDPTVPLILFTIFDSKEVEVPAQKAGICAVVPKRQAWQLLSTIEAAIAQ